MGGEILRHYCPGPALILSPLAFILSFATHLYIRLWYAGILRHLRPELIPSWNTSPMGALLEKYFFYTVRNTTRVTITYEINLSFQKSNFYFTLSAFVFKGQLTEVNCVTTDPLFWNKKITLWKDNADVFHQTPQSQFIVK